MRRIAIILHRQGSFDKPLYFLRMISDVWREQGIDVRVVHALGQPVEADLAIQHIDLTVVPNDHLAYLKQYDRVINGNVHDISKRRISAFLLQQDDAYTGEVIVKTNLNCGGVREARLKAMRPVIGRLAKKFQRIVPWTRRWSMPTSKYRILPSLQAVPRAVWSNKYLIVERFLPERIDGMYGLRTWVFLGDAQTHSLSYSAEPIVKSENVVKRETLTKVPEELHNIRQQLGFDYGKFDYGIVDGRIVLYDVNTTPTLGSLAVEEVKSRIHLLADGIKTFF